MSHFLCMFDNLTGPREELTYWLRLVDPRGHLLTWASCVSLTEGDPGQGKVWGRPECPELILQDNSRPKRDGSRWVDTPASSALGGKFWNVLPTVSQGSPAGLCSSCPVWYPILPFISSLCHFPSPSPCFRRAPSK